MKILHVDVRSHLSSEKIGLVVLCEIRDDNESNSLLDSYFLDLDKEVLTTLSPWVDLDQKELHIIKHEINYLDPSNITCFASYFNLNDIKNKYLSYNKCDSSFLPDFYLFEIYKKISIALRNFKIKKRGINIGKIILSCNSNIFTHFSSFDESYFSLNLTRNLGLASTPFFLLLEREPNFNGNNLNPIEYKEVNKELFLTILSQITKKLDFKTPKEIPSSMFGDC